MLSTRSPTFLSLFSLAFHLFFLFLIALNFYFDRSYDKGFFLFLHFQKNGRKDM